MVSFYQQPDWLLIKRNLTLLIQGSIVLCFCLYKLTSGVTASSAWRCRRYVPRHTLSGTVYLHSTASVTLTGCLPVGVVNPLCHTRLPAPAPIHRHAQSGASQARVKWRLRRAHPDNLLTPHVQVQPILT
jgi:hypothetical protein